MTSGLPTRLPARPLTLSLVGARLVAITAPPGSRESPVAGFATIFPAHPLRVPRGRLGHERRAALGTSATGGHCASVAPAWIVAAFPAAKWITIRPRSGARSRGRVDHYAAAKWIRGTRPLKPPRAARARTRACSAALAETRARARARAFATPPSRAPVHAHGGRARLARGCRPRSSHAPSLEPRAKLSPCMAKARANRRLRNVEHERCLDRALLLELAEHERGPLVDRQLVESPADRPRELCVLGRRFGTCAHGNGLERKTLDRGPPARRCAHVMTSVIDGDANEERAKRPSPQVSADGPGQRRERLLDDVFRQGVVANELPRKHADVNVVQDRTLPPAPTAPLRAIVPPAPGFVPPRGGQGR